MPGKWKGKGGGEEGGEGRKVRTPPPSIPAYAPDRRHRGRRAVGGHVSPTF